MAPFPVGDSTLSAEAMRLVVSSLVGKKTLARRGIIGPPPNAALAPTAVPACAQEFSGPPANATTPSGLPPTSARPSAVARDSSRRIFLLVNDGTCSPASTVAGCVNASALAVSLDISAWGLPPGTLRTCPRAHALARSLSKRSEKSRRAAAASAVPVAVAAANSFGEVQALINTTTSPLVNFTVPAYGRARERTPPAARDTSSQPWRTAPSQDCANRGARCATAERRRADPY